MDKKVKAEAKFWASDNLTYSTAVDVDVEGSGSFTFGEDTAVTFSSWPSGTTSHVSESGLTNSVGSTMLTLTWKYKVDSPFGTGSWVAMANTSGAHKIFRVYGGPECTSSEYTTDHLEKATEYADGGGPGDSSVCTTLQSYLHNHQNFVADTGPNGENGAWNIIEPGGPSNQGDCSAHANLMKLCLEVLGIDASYAFVADAFNQPSEYMPMCYKYYCVTHDREEAKWFREQSGGAVWPFEGVCKVGNTCYDVAWSTTTGTYEYCKTVGNGIVYEWVYMYPDDPEDPTEWHSCDDQGGTHTIIP
ncbi:MAG TPA: hypothetical protein VMW16_15555 [Sedimentisphaerales bacterium]|nr:hypothetical protein [Sedimentisphaerales bacterium]